MYGLEIFKRLYFTVDLQYLNSGPNLSIFFKERGSKNVLNKANRLHNPAFFSQNYVSGDEQFC